MYQEDGHTSTYAGEEGENYFTKVEATATEIADPETGYEGYEIAWTFQINNHWPEVEDAINFGVFASDDEDLESGWDYDNTKASSRLTENHPPDSPANLAQLDPSGSEIPVGDAVDIDSVVFRAAVTDPDADKVKLQVEVRRLDELSGGFDETQGGLRESDLVTSGTSTTCTAYGLVDGSYHWRARVVDEHGLASDWVQFGNNNLSEADFSIANNLAEKIDSLLRIGIYVDPYLLTAEGFADSVTTIFLDFTDWLTRTDLTGTYDDLYWLGFDYADLAYVALVRARRAVDAGNLDLARGWYERYEGYSTASRLAFDAALEVFENHVDIATQIADAIRQGCQAAVKFGLRFVSPTAAEVADYVYLAVDYGVDRALHDKEVALRNAVIGVLVKGLFDYVEFDAIGGRTLADWSKNRVGKSLFPMLTKVFRDNETMQWAVSKVMKEAAVSLEEKLVESLARKIAEAAGWCDNSLSVSVECPVELKVTDIEGRKYGVEGGALVKTMPMATYLKDEVLVFFPTDKISYIVTGIAAGTYKLSAKVRRNGLSDEFSTDSMEIGEGGIHTYEVDWENIAIGKPGVIVSIDEEGDGIVDDTVTIGNHQEEGDLRIVVGPNPISFSGCAFWLDLPRGISQAKIMIFNVAGQPVFETSLDVNSTRFPSAGTWNPVDQNGVPLANGPYVYVLIADGKVIGKGKMVVQR